MSAKPKDLNYYLQNPDEMPTDPKEIEQLAQNQMQASMESGQQELTVDRFVSAEEPKDDTKGAASGTDAEAKAKEQAEAQAKAEQDAAALEAAEKAKPVEPAKPEGVLAADGKNVIPFAVLKNARERAEAAERLVAEQTALIERLKAGAGVATVDTEMLGEEELAALAEDSPTLAKVLKNLQDQNKALSGTVESLAKQREQEVAGREADVKTEVQLAIDSNPTLTEWQNAEDQTMWNEASKFDKLLRTSPAYQDKTFAERFEKVVELTQSALGIAPAVETQNETTLTQAQVKAAAQAKLTAQAKKSMPVSLSQIPGGAPPAVDEKEKVEQMSPVALGNTLLNLGSKEAIDAYLASL